MTPIKCELCGSTDFVKDNGLFVCQHCGTKYTLDEARKIMGTVKIDNSDSLAKLYDAARTALNTNNIQSAGRYYEQILAEDPYSWEAAFYSVICLALQCRVGEINNVATKIEQSLDGVTTLLKNSGLDSDALVSAATELTNTTKSVASTLQMNADDYYNKIGNKNFDGSTNNNGAITFTMIQRIKASLGGKLITKFSDNEEVYDIGLDLLKETLYENTMSQYSSDINIFLVNKGLTEYIQKIDPTYVPPSKETASQTRYSSNSGPSQYSSASSSSSAGNGTPFNYERYDRSETKTIHAMTFFFILLVCMVIVGAILYYR